MNLYERLTKVFFATALMTSLMTHSGIAGESSRVWEAVGSKNQITKLPDVQKDTIYHKSKVKVEDTDFHTNMRAPHVERFPCTNCHTKSLKINQNSKNGKMRRTHWEIEAIHPKDNLECGTCHLTNKGKLKMINGAPVEIDRAYKVCGQCHGPVLKDWKGGAHGKRLTGWGKERVIENCTGCHDPHSPKFKSKRPEINVTYPQR